MAVAVSEKQEAGESAESLDLAAVGRTAGVPIPDDATPEVSDILATVPWWAARGLVYIIIAAVLLGLLWAKLSIVDITVEARGALIPAGYVRPVQSPVGGVVRYVRVREGDRVVRGQPLIQLDSIEQTARVTKLRESLAAAREQVTQLQPGNASFVDTLDKENRIKELEREITAAEVALKYTIITAPETGIVTTLAVRGPGAVLQAGEKALDIAPSGARLVAELRVQNQDIALIERGMAARLKLDAFPYQDYGTVDGTVVDISPDAQDDSHGSHYKVRIALNRTSMTANGKSVPLKPGLSTGAEIVTERKSVMDLFLERFRRM